jgi:cellulose synthase/poly-beta-1,6-N-acetylglucosamine synthase-like glycosyltransferase
MAPVLVSLIVILCLLISIVKYTLALILKWSVPGAKVKKDYTYQPAVGVLMPCFNEGKTVYETIESISKSNYPSDKFDLELLGEAETSAALDFHNQLTTAQLLLEVETGDATFRRDQLNEFPRRNF